MHGLVLLRLRPMHRRMDLPTLLQMLRRMYLPTLLQMLQRMHPQVQSLPRNQLQLLRQLRCQLISRQLLPRQLLLLRSLHLIPLLILWLDITPTGRSIIFAKMTVHLLPTWPTTKLAGCYLHWKNAARNILAGN